MEKEKVKNIVREEICQKLIQLINELSTNEFVESILDKVYEKTGEVLEEELEDVIGIIGDELMNGLNLIIYNHSLTTKGNFPI
jgi:hypothetical protein